MVYNSGIYQAFRFYRGTYRVTGAFTYDNGRAFPVYRKVGDSRVYLAHDDSSTTFNTPWLFYYNDRPGRAVGHIGLGWSTLLNPADERVRSSEISLTYSNGIIISNYFLQAIQYYDFNRARWVFTRQASVVCTRNRALETEADLLDDSLTNFDADDDGVEPEVPEIPDGETPEEEDLTSDIV